MKQKLFFLLLISNLCFSQNDDSYIIPTEKLTTALAEISTNLRAITNIKNKKYDDDIKEDKNLIKSHEISINNKFEADGNNVFFFNPFLGSPIATNADEILIVKDILAIFKLDVSEISNIGFSNIKIHKNASKCNYVYTATFKLKCNVYKEDGDGNKVSNPFSLEELVNISISPNTHKIAYILSSKYINSNKDTYSEFFILDINCNNIADNQEDTDGDGIKNDSDKCPEEFGVNVDGCPLNGIEKSLILAESERELIRRERDSFAKIQNIDKEISKLSQEKLKESNQRIAALQAEVRKLREAKNSSKGVQSDTIDCYNRSNSSYTLKNKCPDRDFDNDGIINKNDKCVKRKGSKDNSGCPKRWGLNISLGTGVMFHPKVYTIEDENTYTTETVNTSLLFDSSKGFPLEVDASIQYRFNELGKLKHGIVIGGGYNTYSFRYFDENNQPPFFGVNVGNTVSYASYVSTRVGYFFEFGDKIFYYSNSDRKKTRLEVGYNQRFRVLNWLNKDQPKFQFADPSYAYFRARFSIVYLNFEYPLIEFINSRIISQNSSFNPFILSLGVEIPFSF